METPAYRRLLVRLLALPILALALLALITAYGFRQAQQSARRVDRADQAIAHASNLVKLMVDEETGLRGYLLTRDPVFLEPYHKATKDLDPEFATLFRLTRRDPEQTARLQRMQTASRAWQQFDRETIAIPTPASDLKAQMFERKQQMDALRASDDDFLSAETRIRAGRSFTSLRINNLTFYGLIGLAAMLGVLIAWEISRLFEKLSSTYNLQLKEVQRRGDESYAREQWLNTTLRSIGDAVIACDPEGKVVFMNGVAEQLTGWKEREADGAPLSKIFVIYNQRTHAIVENPVEVVRRSGKIVGLANHTVLVSKDGSEFQIDDSAAPILNKDARMIGVVLVFRDISERYASERALIRAEKLASAGRLAAAIAHEVNNPLEGLVNLIYLARSQEDIGSIRRHLLEADRELQRIAHITRQSLGFYRENSAAGLFRPDVVVREVFDFYSFRAAQAHVGLHVNTKTEQKAWGNSGEFRQVISNLLANSLDACRSGDAICVRVRAARSPRDPALKGTRVVVADTGCGIEPENLHRIFEPFFTTKKDTGTGLGLWVSRELIEKHGGHLSVRSSAAGRRTGTVFSLFLPGSIERELEVTRF
ncbi:MAG TPA: CHASE3 domain-containing protein [Acidobacteriaceae bacterium]|nr:CHASE3 domain-containing protein [Acidobacteriaceae bacterium]